MTPQDLPAAMLFARLGSLPAVAPSRALFLSAITTCSPQLTSPLFLGVGGPIPHLTSGGEAVFFDVSSPA